jgi:integrase
MTQRRRRRFGSIRRRSSGSYQVRYWGPDDVRHSAPMTFARKSDAERWLTLLEGRVIRGEWSPPSAPRITLAEYVQTWIAQRSLEPRTRELYESQLRNHIEPYLRRKTLDTITPQTIRNWRQQLLEAGRSATVAAKSYRLLRAVLNTAVKEDQLIAENPCRIPGYDKEVSPERPVGTIPQVIALSELVAPRFRALVLLAAFTGLRWGELVAVRRCDLDLDAGTVRISRKFAELRDGRRVAGRPKSAAGVRVVALPAMLVDAMKRHLAKFPAEDEELIFRGPLGAPLRRNNFHRSVRWSQSVVQAGLPAGFHFHDLRHTGNNLAAACGASTRELMHRMGHGTMRAALIYQHATGERDREIADALQLRIERELKEMGPIEGPRLAVDGSSLGLAPKKEGDD